MKESSLEPASLSRIRSCLYGDALIDITQSSSAKQTSEAPGRIILEVVGIYTPAGRDPDANDQAAILAYFLARDRFLTLTDRAGKVVMSSGDVRGVTPVRCRVDPARGADGFLVSWVAEVAVGPAISAGGR